MTGSDFKICVYKGEYDLVAVFDDMAEFEASAFFGLCNSDDVDDVDFPYTMLKVSVPKGFVCEA